MRSISASEFKAKCLALLDEMSRGGAPVTITKRGVPVAQIGPPVSTEQRRRELGRLAGTMRVVGDIEAPVLSAAEWEEPVLRRWDELER